MKVEELMVGDWIRWKDTKKSFKIETYTSFYSHFEYEPIPITVEILKKNDFEKIEENNKWCWKYNNLQGGAITIFIQFNKMLNFEILNGWLVHRKFIGELEYVHELQHILKLCKINKDIIL